MTIQPLLLLLTDVGILVGGIFIGMGIGLSMGKALVNRTLRDRRRKRP